MTPLEDEKMNGFRLIFGLFLVSLAGCAAAPIVDEYPTREIDQPFTLPKGMASWETLIGYEHERYPDDDFYHSSLLYPLVWNQALSDTWQLTWMPLPLGVRHQIHRDETGYWGATLGLGGGYSSIGGWMVQPSPSIERRMVLGPDFALDTSLYGTFRIPFRDNGYWSSDWLLGVSFRPVFQLSNRFSIGPAVSVVSERQSIVTLDFTDIDPIRESVSRKVRFPMGVHSSWRISRRWEMVASYSLARLGYPRGYTRHTTQASFHYYW